MECKPENEVDNYVFFKKIENYIDTVNKAQDSSTGGWVSNCKAFSAVSNQWFNDNQIAKDVCEELIKLYKSLDSLKNKSKPDMNYGNDCTFFNYWVNFKISKSMINESGCIKDIYNGIESQFQDCDFYNMFDIGVIYDITKEELDKLNILYSLYEKYSKLKSIINDISQLNKESLSTLSTACCPGYIEANYICNNGNADDDGGDDNSQFCIELGNFKTKYQELYTKVHSQKPELSDYFIKLSKCPNNKIITTAVTGSIIGLIPLFGVLYKFTPMGQVIRSKIGIINNDEEMTKMTLMEQENEPLRFKQGTYNIKYQSL
ncbi:Plasmodium vivax Vir protein, putative [Plasmodium vivax]|uniref:Vir protein, putative n=1 Tax=Plasmodium vivax TaxID=5855 RepID=A0A1G4EFR0_PLAVI|nr:Plasmodium vivax Vir protein, putative [Plasmodium vivax]